jgi:SAM-dependent methyltransferase
VVAIDPSLGAIMASRRAFSGIGLQISYVCGDARFLPFNSSTFQCAFSYSVIQHFSEADAQLALAEVGRVLKQNGFAKIQMAHRGGVRSTYNRTRLDYEAAGPFRVRYWSLASIRHTFELNIGSTKVSAEAYGGLGLLAEDKKYVSTGAKLLIAVSQLMKTFAVFVKPLIWLADSVYVVSVER